MMISFPMKFKLIRRPFVPIVTIGISGKKELEDMAVYQCYVFSTVAQKYHGVAMENAEPLKPDAGEDMVASIQFIFENVKFQDLFVKYLQTDPTMGGA